MDRTAQLPPQSSIIHSLFGQFSWKKPPWASSLFGLIGSPKARKVIMVLLGIGVVSLGGYLYNHYRPKPNVVVASVQAPLITPLAAELKPNPVVIQFDSAAARLDQMNKRIVQGITLSPTIPGDWIWEGDRRLRFNPKQDWPAGQEYQIEMDPALFAQHVKLQEYTLHFLTPAFSANLTNLEFYRDPNLHKVFRVVATIEFTHPVNPGSVKPHISFTTVEKEKIKTYPFQVEFDAVGRRAYLQSDPFPLPEKQNFMHVVLAEGMVPAKGQGTTKRIDKDVLVPDIYSFLRVDELRAQIVRNANSDPQQVISLRMTDELKAMDVAKKLTVYLLPVNKGQKIDKEAEESEEFEKFQSPREITPEILKISKKVNVTLLPTEKETTEVLFLTFRAPPKQQLYVKLEKGLTSVNGFVTAQDYDQLLEVPMFPREVQIQQQGSLLSLTGEKKVLLLTRGVPAVKIEIGRVMEDRLQYIATQTGGDFQSPRFLDQYQFNEEDMTERFEEIKTFPNQDPAKAVYSTFDLGKYLNTKDAKKQGIFFISIRAWNPKDNQYIERSSSELEEEAPDGNFQAKRLIMVTDLGVLVKENADRSRDVFVQSIHLGTPVAHATVSVLGKNGLPVVTGTTSELGRVTFSSMENLKREKMPAAYLIRQGEDISFLPFNRDDRRLNFSHFDVGGIRSIDTESHLNAFVFSDRGIYRPGEDIHIGLVVKQDQFKQDLSGVPIEVVMTDSKSQTAAHEMIKLSSAGFEELKFSTQPSSPTGDYNIEVFVLKNHKRDAQIGSTYLRVQEFLPDRLKIEARLTESVVKGWVTPDQIHARVSLMQLFGSPAENRIVQGKMTLTRSHFHFSEYDDFQFTNPSEDASRTLEVAEDLLAQKTDGNGNAEFPLHLERFAKASYRCTFFAQGFEAEGGRSVSGLSTVLVSPVHYMVGMKPDGDITSVKPNSKRFVEAIAIDAQLQKKAIFQLQLRFLKQQYVSTLMKQENGTYKYQSILQELSVKEQEIDMPKEGSQIELLTEKPGDYVLVLVSHELGQDVERARFHYTVFGNADVDASRSRNAELKVNLDRREYRPGDTIEVSITAPYTGAGLITIERDKVYAFKWFQSSTTTSKQTIEVPKDFDSNGYVHVIFVRDLQSHEIFMSPMSYGVAPFDLNKEQHTVQLTLQAKNKVRPGDDLAIEVKANQKAKAIVFAVDEGILQVANYKTPNPLAYFFQKRALEVSTSQILDLILPEVSVIKEVSQAGGGESQDQALLSKNLNPFRRKNEPPVAYWSSLIDVDAQTKTLHYLVPDSYAGTLRLMAVVVSENAFGRQEKPVVVEGDFVLSPNVPTFVAPGDEFDVSVAIFNHAEGSGKDAPIRVSVSASPNFEILKSPQQVIKISENHEAVARFTLKTKQQLGAADLTFDVSFEKSHAKQSASISVRPVMPYRSEIQSGILSKATEEIQIQNSMYPEFQKLEASVARFPISLVPGLLRYIEGYPYGCTEQVVSKAFALLPFVTDSSWRAVLGIDSTMVAQHMQEALDTLRRRQNSNGAFGYWSADQIERISFVSVYATHFLLEAKKNQYGVPADLLHSALQNLEQMVVLDPASLVEARIQAYAIYILTESGIVTTNYLNRLREYLDQSHRGLWGRDLTAVYMAATYKLLKKDREALLLLDGFAMFGKDSKHVPSNMFDDYYSPLVANSQYVSILSELFPERSDKVKTSDLDALANPIIDSEYSTLSVAYAVHGLFSYLKKHETPESASFSITGIDESTGAQAEKIFLTNPLFVHGFLPIHIGKLVFSAPADAKGYGYYQFSRSGFSKVLPTREQKGGIEIYREYVDGEKPLATSNPAVLLGQDLTVKLTLRVLSKTTLSHIAVVDLLPGGFEIVTDSLPSIEHPQHGIDFAEAREDRVIWYGSFSDQPTTLTYRIHATNAGVFAVPPAFCQSMYRHEIEAYGLPGTIFVKPAEKH